MRPDGGRITLSTASVRVESSLEAESLGLKQGEYVILTVTDTGTGMAPDILEKVFEPFYTTKGAGDGLGLGLAISSSIVGDLGGRLKARNRPEGGAVFEMVLPRFGEDSIAAE